MKQRADRIASFALVVAFTVVVQGLSLMEFLPLPIALLIGAGWAVLICIPIAIAANVPTELVIIPVLLVLGWRPGSRRILFVTAAALYFVHRIWTYLVFAPDRLDFAAAERSTAVLTAAEKDQFTAALHVDDPRWINNLLIFAVLLLSAFFSRLREVNSPTVAAPTARG
ncbi:hypothetical protein [Verrucosispora sp. WMMD1129]|uniref:hypothetical protein n=1 Tax=Verrucosispora sp. WMMD1129 TaxID=3016093 RepID=UPI002499E493|nr:hypothetical protein [Verrucosispora sp. WMMD1129]WFE47783.1 hypothetical protein O7624_27335 [Verrucosispora sp. WMMD1129]